MLALALAVSVSGCGKTKKTADSGEKITITWLSAPQNPGASEGSYSEKLIEERFNVELKPIFYAQQNYNDKKTMLLAGGEIPDVIYELDPSFVAEDVNQGFLAKIPYSEIAEKAPTLYKTIKDEEPKAWLYSRVDGENYGIPNLAYSNKLGRLGLWRMDWLEKKGITKVPETIDEMHEALVQITKGDPDGNGVNDTFGMSGDISNWHTMFTEVFGAYGVLPYNWMLKDGKVVYGGFADGITDAIDTISSWYKEGLIHPDFTTDNVFDSGKEKFTSGVVGYVNQHGGYLNSANKNSIDNVVKEIFPEANVVSAKFIKGPKGDSGVQCWGSPCHIIAFGKQVEEDEAKRNKILEIFETLMTDEEFLKDVKIGKEKEMWNYNDPAKGFKGGITFVPPYDDATQLANAGFDSTATFASPTFFAPVTPTREVYNEFVSDESMAFIKEYKQEENGHTDLFIKPDVLPSASKYFADLRTQQIDLVVKAIKGEITSGEYLEKFKAIWEKGGGPQLQKEAESLNSDVDSITAEVLKF